MAAFSVLNDYPRHPLRRELQEMFLGNVPPEAASCCVPIDGRVPYTRYGFKLKSVESHGLVGLRRSHIGCTRYTVHFAAVTAGVSITANLVGEMGPEKPCTSNEILAALGRSRSHPACSKINMVELLSKCLLPRDWRSRITKLVGAALSDEHQSERDRVHDALDRLRKQHL